MLYRSTEINANLTKGAAGSADILQLLRLWREGEAPAAFERRAIEENLLGKASRSRARDLVKGVLARRFFPEGSAEPAVHVARLARAALPREVVLQVMYYHTARAEHLLYLVATELVYGLGRQGIDAVTTDDVVRYVRRLHAEGRAERDYSAAVVTKLGQAALTALRDFGVLEGTMRKRIAHFRAPHQVVGYFVYALRDEGCTARQIVQHEDWRLLLLSPGAVEEAILEAAAQGHFTYSAAGDIRRFDWHYPDLDGYVDGITEAAS
jgi:hypothetical protein